MYNINEQLLVVIKKWVSDVLEKDFIGNENSDCAQNGDYIGKIKKRIGQSLSCPFYMGVSKDYEINRQNKPRVMVIGQEARHYGSWKTNRDDFGYKAEESQQWAIEYLQCQLKMPTIENSRFNICYNKSKFWNAFRALDRHGLAVCWSNVDKVYYSMGNATYKGTLTYDAERILSEQYGADCKSLLQREIEIVAPDFILFVTGPTYYISMATAFGVSENELSKKPTKSNPIINISDDLRINIPTFWTYHPNNQLGINSANVFIEKIKTIINQK